MDEGERRASQGECVEVEDKQIKDAHDVTERPKRTRTLTEKGLAYQMETLRRIRDDAYTKLRQQVNTICVQLISDVTLEGLEAKRNELDLLKEDVNQAYKNYSDVLTLEEDKETSYKWFDQCDREFQEFRTRVTERIHALERDIPSQRPLPSISNYSKFSHRSKGSTKSHRSKGSANSHRSEGSSRSSARARRALAAARLARLQVEREFIDKESEIRRIQLRKEIAMASAEEAAMRKIVEEEEQSTKNSKGIAATGLQTRVQTVSKSQSNPDGPCTSRNYEDVQALNLNNLKARIIPDRCMERSQIDMEDQVTSVQCQTNQQGNGACINYILHLQAQQTELSAMIVEQHRSSLLPLQEPPLFDGNYFDYPVFMRAFEVIIESRVSSNRDRLYFLNKYTTGKANEIIKVFISSKSESSYTKAKQLLAERYGDPHRVSDAYKARLKEWPNVKEGNSVAYQEYSDFLCRCAVVMKEMRYLDDLNSSETLKLISGKLPSYSGVRWCRYAFDIKKKQYRPVVFDDVVMFVKEEAELATDPVFSPDAMKTDRKRGFEKEKKKKQRFHGVSSFGTLTSQNSVERDSKSVAGCVKCLKSHHLNDCGDFNRLTLKERQQFVKKSGLCFGCLRVGHLARDCRNRLICKECKKSHPTSLHYPFQIKEDTSNDERKEIEDKSVNNCTNICKDEGSCGITKAAIIPVWLRHKDNPVKEVMVYALLDNASDSTFVKTSVLNELEVKGTDVSLDLFTMLGKQEISVQKIEGLVVSRMDRRVEIQLTKSYSRDVIPSRKNQIPTPETVDQWPHLRRIKDKLYPYQDGVCVGVLIGCNCLK